MVVRKYNSEKIQKKIMVVGEYNTERIQKKTI
jgi:hypothetical protein